MTWRRDGESNPEGLLQLDGLASRCSRQSACPSVSYLGAEGETRTPTGTYVPSASEADTSTNSITPAMPFRARPRPGSVLWRREGESNPQGRFQLVRFPSECSRPSACLSMRFLVLGGGLEPPRPLRDTRLSTLHVYQFHHPSIVLTAVAGRQHGKSYSLVNEPGALSPLKRENPLQPVCRRGFWVFSLALELPAHHLRPGLGQVRPTEPGKARCGR